MHNKGGIFFTKLTYCLTVIKAMNCVVVFHLCFILAVGIVLIGFTSHNNPPRRGVEAGALFRVKVHLGTRFGSIL